jgi:CheY-specific phosphatase CheX
VIHAFCGVFDTMLSLKLVPLPAGGSPPEYLERVTGCVGFAGEKVNGAVYVHLPGAFARQAAASMLGIAPEEVEGDEVINDVVGEMCNMVTGGLKSSLCDSGLPCAVSTPAIIRGSSFEIEAMPNVRREILYFDCREHRLTLEVHIKFL